jgi:signal transduction histidine kinase
LPTEAQQEKYRATLVLLDEAAAELRNISYNIMPAALSKLGLPAAIKNLVDKISSSSGLQVHFEAHGFENRIDESTEISIYRMILELLNNIVKHANARKATIQVIRYPDYIDITVEDDGSGFDYKRITEQSKGIGLGNILSRVEYLKGTIDIDALPGRGTTVIIDIPYRGMI